MKITKLLHSLCITFWFCSLSVLPANTLVTFQVDMGTASFVPGVNTVTAHGTFDNWGPGLPLTNNPAGANPNLYSGTLDVATNGTVMQYKYVIDSSGWETIPKGNNRLALLPETSGASLVLPISYYADIPPATIDVNVTFQVDLAQQINVGNFDKNTSIVYPKGTFNNWGAFDPMTNNPAILRTNQNGLVTSNVYVNTYLVTCSPGQTMDFKYYIDTGNRYESPVSGAIDPADNNNRFLNTGDGAPLTLPLVFFSDLPYAPVATNVLTFQVDMSAQVLNGNFDPFTGTVEVRGSFNGWGSTATYCTNDPFALNTNLYTAVVTVVDGLGVRQEYKFWASVPVNTGWETSPNRSFTMISGTSQAMPVVFFSNINPEDLASSDTLVTFRVDMANAVQYPGGTPFDPGVNAVYFNGDCLTNGWYSPWGGLWPETQMVDDGTKGDAVAGDKIYTLQYLVPKGKTLRVQYKYGIDSADNEAATGSDHVRYIRTVGTYQMPVDTFGTQFQEASFGDLTIGPPVAGKVLISWLGRPGVYLQSNADLTGGAWDTHLATDGLSSTNFSVGSSSLFFRLVEH